MKKRERGDICPYCNKRELYSWGEVAFGICNPCADKQAERARERAEFEYYHPKD